MEIEKEFMRDVLLVRSRYTGSLFEAFYESQASLRVQLSYYLALCIVFSQKTWDFSSCIAENVIGEDTKVFLKFNKIMIISPLAGLLSLTLAQYHLYKKKHEFDVGFKGSILYLFASLFAILSKLSCQILFTTVFYALAITTIESDEYWLRWIYFSIPNILIDILHTMKERVINKSNDGYYLSLKFLPTTTAMNEQIEHWRFAEGN